MMLWTFSCEVSGKDVSSFFSEVEGIPSSELCNDSILMCFLQSLLKIFDPFFPPTLQYIQHTLN